MSGTDRYRRSLPALQDTRTGIAAGNVPILPANSADAWELANCFRSHGACVAAMHNYNAMVAAFAAGGMVMGNQTAQIEGLREAQAELQHQRELAELRRNREVYEAQLQVTEAKQRLEAAEEFKEEKFALGAARFAEKRAKYQVGEATARAAINEEILEAEPTHAERPKSASTAEVLARLIDDRESEIDQAEMAGRPTEGLRGELKALNAALRRELLKPAGK